MTTTIRVEDELHARLRAISRSEHRPMGDILKDAVLRYEREKFWDDVEASVDQLRSDPKAWTEYQAEIQQLEGGSMDGLEREPPYFTPEEIEAILGDTRNTTDR